MVGKDFRVLVVWFVVELMAIILNSAYQCVNGGS